MPIRTHGFAAIAAVAALFLCSCTRFTADFEKAPQDRVEISLLPTEFTPEQEASMVIEFLASDRKGTTPGNPVAVGMRSRELEELVFDWAEDRGLHFLPRDQFGVKTGTLYEFDKPHWGDNGIVLLPGRLIGNNELAFTGKLRPVTAVYDSAGFSIENGLDTWEPAVYEPE